jgi:hypothetical protein
MESTWLDASALHLFQILIIYSMNAPTSRSWTVPNQANRHDWILLLKYKHLKGLRNPSENKFE